MRTRLLLALAHAEVCLGTTALAYIEETRAYFLARPRTPDWEIAFADAQAWHEGFAAIARDEDREVVQRVFRSVPRP
jgi:hypothetical protein